MSDRCPFCRRDPYCYVDVGVGGRGVPVAVDCCEYGILLFDWRTSRRLNNAAKRLAEEIGNERPDKRRMRRFLRTIHGKSIRHFGATP